MEGKVGDLALNPFVVQFALVFLPGLLWSRMNATFIVKGRQSGIDFLVGTFLYGITSYVLVFVIFSLLHKPFYVVSLNAADKRTVITASVAKEIVIALGVSFMCAIVNVYASTYGWLFKALRLVRATKRYGSEDIWDFTFNLKSPNVEYVHVRDFDNKLVYSGWVDAFSETDRLRELTLRGVEVHNFEGEFFYAVPRLYLARRPEGVHIEFPADPTQKDPLWQILLGHAQRMMAIIVRLVRGMLKRAV